MFCRKSKPKKIPAKENKTQKGKILNPDGKIIGEHDGIYYYTIGQRLGPRYGFEIDRGNKNKPSKWYVAKKDVKTNTITAAPENHPLNFRKNIIIKNLHLISNKKETFQNKPTKVFSRIRHVGELLPSIFHYNKKTKQFQITLNEAITGVSEGQAVVIYEKDKVIGGGEIIFQ